MFLYSGLSTVLSVKCKILLSRRQVLHVLVSNHHELEDNFCCISCCTVEFQVTSTCLFLHAYTNYNCMIETVAIQM